MEKQETGFGDWITTAEAAKLLGLTARRVRQLAKAEAKFDYKLVTPRLMLVRRTDIERYKGEQ